MKKVVIIEDNVSLSLAFKEVINATDAFRVTDVYASAVEA